MDTYRAGVECLSSESTIHTILKDNITPENFDVKSNQATHKHILDTIGLINAVKESGLSNKEKTITIKDNLPESFIQKRIKTSSYQALRSIYFQRRFHILRQWKDFCKVIEGLPYASRLITAEDNT